MDASGLTPLAGGWSGETFLAEAAGERSVVRIYARPRPDRGEAPQEVDAALLRLVRGLVPVPEVLEARRADPASGAPALLVTSWVAGTRADELLPTLGGVGLAMLGRNLGTVAADLAVMPVLRGGPFVDGDLRIGSWTHDGRDVDGLPAFLDVLAVPGVDHARLLPVLEEAQALLDTVDRCSLVHGDLNPKNVLVDAESLDVRAVLDWEFAHAGHPFTDLGNLVRFDRDPAYLDGVLGAWIDRHGGRKAEALAMARAADLWALLELASRVGSNPVADRAHARLLAITSSGDPSAA